MQSILLSVITLTSTPTVLGVVLQRPQRLRVEQRLREALLLHPPTPPAKVMEVMVEVEVEGKEAMEVRGKEVMVEAGEEGAIAATSFLATACISGEDHNHLIGPRTMEAPGFGALCRFVSFKSPLPSYFFADCAGALLYPYL